MPWGYAARSWDDIGFLPEKQNFSLRIILKNKNQNGQSDLQDKQIYFDIHRGD
jgi:hypothetical protein